MQLGKSKNKRELTSSSQKPLLTNLLGIVKLFSKAERVKLSIIVVIQLMLSMLDLIGVAMIGVIGALAVRGVQAQAPGYRVSTLLEFLGIESRTLQFQVAILAVIVAIALIGRTAISVFLTKKSLLFLSRRAAKLTSDLLRGALDLSLIDLRLKSSQDFLFSLTNGVNIIMLGIVASVVTAI